MEDYFGEDYMKETTKEFQVPYPELVQVAKAYAELGRLELKKDSKLSHIVSDKVPKVVVKPPYGFQPENSTPDCLCPATYHPVCGSDGKTYPNNCSLKCKRKLQDSRLQKISNGECTIKYKPNSYVNYDIGGDYNSKIIMDNYQYIDY